MNLILLLNNILLLKKEISFIKLEKFINYDNNLTN